MRRVNEDSNLFFVPVGCDFTRHLITGLEERLPSNPVALARCTIFVNTQRMKRRLKTLIMEKSAALHPKIHLISDLANDPLNLLDLPTPLAPLRRELILAQLVQKLLKSDDGIAPSSAMFEITKQLTALLDEAQGEGVSLKEIRNIDIQDLSGHWGRTKEFLSIIADHWDQNGRKDKHDRMRFVAEEYGKIWQNYPPKDPIIFAGSTGSRGESAAFMEAILGLENGAVILPGFDYSAPMSFWENMMENRHLDHPQSGYANLLNRFKLSPKNLSNWVERATPNNPSRNALISLSVRPAPITNQWLNEGPKLLTNLNEATKDLELIEAPNPAKEALAIACAIRSSVQNENPIVLITPNRDLSRRVSNQLKRWKIIPDDSAGSPLHLAPAGVFLRSIGRLRAGHLKAEHLIAILKHPLTHAVEKRNEHILNVQALELGLLRGKGPDIDVAKTKEWLEGDQTITEDWKTWLISCISSLLPNDTLGLNEWIEAHVSLAEKLNQGVSEQKDLTLWKKEDGKAAHQIFAELRDHANFAGQFEHTEYFALINGQLRQELRSEIPNSSPFVSIWGTLEARVQTSSTVILAGLNEGVWPKAAGYDIWLNRNLRDQMGLLVPERQIGLAAHDYQQAMGTAHVIISRSIRENGAPTTASRWVIRLKNLLEGLGEEGQTHLKSMQARGAKWVQMAEALQRVSSKIPAEPRPAPIPPKEARLLRLSVTRVKDLVKDPYKIYAKEILRLKRLQPIGKEADAMERGTVIHQILEEFTSTPLPDNPQDAVDNFMALSNEVIAQTVPWPMAGRLWLGRISRISKMFVMAEYSRQMDSHITALEATGSTEVAELGLKLTTKIDRIDEGKKGLRIYDYKSNKAPSKADQKQFDKQLELEAAIVRRGGVNGINPGQIEHLQYIGLNQDPTDGEVTFSEDSLNQIWQEFLMLIRHYTENSGAYIARDKTKQSDFASDYDHLSRYGEWEEDSEPTPKAVP